MENIRKTHKSDHQTNRIKLTLSPNQKRLWIISQMNRENPAYNLSFTYLLKGKVNFKTFHRSMEILCNRHVSFFSLFKQTEGEPYCEIMPKQVKVELIDFSHLPLHLNKEKTFAFASEDVRKPFNLETGPLFRFYLLKSQDEEFYFHATIHHLIFDGWSWKLFVEEFSRIYNDINNQIEPNVDSGVIYNGVDKIHDTRLAYNRRKEDRLIGFWRKTLKDLPVLIKFPFDHSHPSVSTGFGGKQRFEISVRSTSKLKELSKNSGTTLYVTLLSTISVLLNKYSGENDICIGVPISFRTHPKLENIIGMFVNIIVTRFNIKEDKPFISFLKQSKNVFLKAIAHSELTFDKIVEAVNPERLTGVNSLFQVSVVWVNDMTMPFELDGIKSERITLRQGVSPFDITFYLWEEGDHIEGEIEYNIDILKRDTILRLKSNFLSLLDRLVNNSERAIKFVPLSSGEEKRTVLSFSGAKVPYPKKKTIAQLFEEQAKIHPFKKAVVFEGKSLTYRQLNEKTNRLARRLRNEGVGRNTPVGILADKSLELIVGILGILKAGGGYVPIDPEYPEQRINHMLADADCRILLTQEEFMDTKVEGVTKVNLNSPVSYHKNRSNIDSINGSSDLAYIMYTSGTTGKPKGSLIAQYSVVRLVRNTNYIALTSDDRILMTGAVVFDATTFEIWGALLNGGTLYIVDKLTILDPETLGKELLGNEITILWLTSPLFTQLAEARTDIFGKLKYLLVGGDVLSASLINKVRRDNPDLKIINGYGPTENTTFSTTYLIEKDFEQNIPIGKPISNSTAYIFDEHMNYQPIGVIGELYVGGDGLSIGYLNRDDLNKSRFIEHPHHPGERLYRTGDYARWLPDGNIEFRGRLDDQLKIRGYRVELKEIETALLGIEGVLGAVVKPWDNQQGERALFAFILVRKSSQLSREKIELELRQELPVFMMPAMYKFMFEFPQKINGKIDRDALIPDEEDIEQRVDKVNETLTETEKIIQKIWNKVLNRKDISVNDNFFEIGGTSLLAITAFSTMENIFHVNLSLREFFDSPKIVDLAETIDIRLATSNTEKSVNRSPDSNNKMIHGVI